MKRRVIRIKTRDLKFTQTRRLRIIVEPGWRNRSHPYWFNVKYPDDGMRRICVPLLTIDIYPRPRRVLA